MNFFRVRIELYSSCQSNVGRREGVRRNRIHLILIAMLACLVTSCITKFIPAVGEEKEVLVVQGLITDQNETDTVKLSKSLPLGLISEATPVTGSIVSISDDQGGRVSLTEIKPGAYITPQDFHGITGLLYTLHITYNNLDYESFPMEMNPVPPIDSLYYEKTFLENPTKDSPGINDCHIYLDTYDPQNNCKYFRWDFTETWKLRLLFPVENQTCWITDKSHSINIKSTAAFNESRILRFPINYITNITDRLRTRYSILVNQYSVTEDEYSYWDKLQNVVGQVGGLYDIIPASVPSNIQCVENPGEKVLGYFSVSAKTSRRIFIQDKFVGIIDRYNHCPSDTIPYIDPPGLGISVWILDDEPYHIAPFRILTNDKGCADCTVRGTTVKPSFWTDDK